MEPVFERGRIGVAAKLTLWLVAGSASAFTVFGYWNLRLHRQSSEALVLESADRISDLIRRSTRYQMLHNDREALDQIIRDIGSEPGIRRVRILNAAGQVSFSSDGARILTDNAGQRLLSLSRAIANEPSCSSASCHAHPPNQKTLGVIDAQFTLAGVDAQLARHQAMQWSFTAAGVLLISAFSIIFVWAVVHRPVRELMAGTRRVAGGDLAYRLPLRSSDELGELAASFNNMTADLSKAHDEITAWGHSLEQRAERKSRELERARAGLANSEKMAAIGKLAATVAHEVNNPLFGILTCAKLSHRELENTNLDPALKTKVLDQIRLIERESHRCGGIIRNLLTFSRQAPGQHAPVEINMLVERAVAVVRHQLELHNIELETKLAGDLPPVNCDSGQIQQVILALLVNASEAMPQGGRLRVATGHNGDERHVAVHVEDNGAGIPADVLPHIFEPYFTTKDDEQRTGLGLAVAWNIVEQHGGSIVAHSTEREGTEFIVTLPAAPAVSGGRA